MVMIVLTKERLIDDTKISREREIFLESKACKIVFFRDTFSVL